MIKTQYRRLAIIFIVVITIPVFFFYRMITDNIGFTSKQVADGQQTEAIIQSVEHRSSMWTGRRRRNSNEYYLVTLAYMANNKSITSGMRIEAEAKSFYNPGDTLIIKYSIADPETFNLVENRNAQWQELMLNLMNPDTYKSP